MGALDYAIGATTGLVEALVTLPWLAAANNLSLNVLEHEGRLYQLSPFRELSWTESHIILPLVNTKLLGVIPLTTVIWLTSIFLSAILGYYVTRHLFHKIRRR